MQPADLQSVKLICTSDGLPKNQVPASNGQPKIDLVVLRRWRAHAECAGCASGRQRPRLPCVMSNGPLADFLLVEGLFQLSLGQRPRNSKTRNVSLAEGHVQPKPRLG